MRRLRARAPQAQGIVPEGEWEAFLASARTTLPATIRINGSGKFAEAIREELRTNFVAAIAGLSAEEADGESITPPFALPWCGVARRRGCEAACAPLRAAVAEAALTLAPRASA